MRWTWVGYLNFALLQWVGLRLYRQVEADGRVSGFGLLGLVLPLTGWWNNYAPRPRWFLGLVRR